MYMQRFVGYLRVDLMVVVLKLTLLWSYLQVLTFRAKCKVYWNLGK